MPHLVIAVWTVDTRKLRVPYANQMAQLAERVRAVWPEMQQAAREAQGDGQARQDAVRYLFVAPEYLFTGTASHFMPEADKEELLVALLALSRDVPELLLIPGSVGWFKTAVIAPAAAERKRRKKQAAAAAAAGSMPQAASASSSSATAPADLPTRRAMGKYVGKIEMFSASLALFPGELKAMEPNMAPDTLENYTTGYTQMVAHQEQALDFKGKNDTDAMRKRLQSNDESARVARNTSYVVQAGELIHKYHKAFEGIGGYGYDNDIEMADRLLPILLLPGDGDPAFTHRGLTYGLELCADHNSAALRIHSRKIRPVDVDVQIIMSASTELDQVSLVGREVIIHADAKGTCVRTMADEKCYEPQKEGAVLVFVHKLADTGATASATP